MSRKARATIASILGATVVVGGFMFLGYHIGLEDSGVLYTGWPAALMVGGIISATILVIALLIAAGIGLAEWIARGE